MKALLKDQDGKPYAGTERLIHNIDALSTLETWRPLSLAPEAWARRFSTLRDFFRPARPGDAADHQMAMQYRSQAAVLDVFDECLSEAAEALVSAAGAQAGEIPIET